MRCKRSHCGCGVVAVAFGSGLVISQISTEGVIIAVLTIAVIILGVLTRY